MLIYLSLGLSLPATDGALMDSSIALQPSAHLKKKNLCNCFELMLICTGQKSCWFSNLESTDALVVELCPLLEQLAEVGISFRCIVLQVSWGLCR